MAASARVAPSARKDNAADNTVDNADDNTAAPCDDPIELDDESRTGILQADLFGLSMLLFWTLSALSLPIPAAGWAEEAFLWERWAPLVTVFVAVSQVYVARSGVKLLKRRYVDHLKELSSILHISPRGRVVCSLKDIVEREGLEAVGEVAEEVAEEVGAEETAQGVAEEATSSASASTSTMVGEEAEKEDILTRLKSAGEDILTRLKSAGEDILTRRMPSDCCPSAGLVQCCLPFVLRRQTDTLFYIMAFGLYVVAPLLFLLALSLRLRTMRSEQVSDGVPAKLRAKHQRESTNSLRFLRFFSALSALWGLCDAVGYTGGDIEWLPDSDSFYLKTYVGLSATQLIILACSVVAVTIVLWMFLGARSCYNELLIDDSNSKSESRYRFSLKNLRGKERYKFFNVVHDVKDRGLSGEFASVESEKEEEPVSTKEEVSPYIAQPETDPETDPETAKPETDPTSESLELHRNYEEDSPITTEARTIKTRIIEQVADQLEENFDFLEGNDTVKKLSDYSGTILPSIVSQLILPEIPKVLVVPVYVFSNFCYDFAFNGLMVTLLLLTFPIVFAGFSGCWYRTHISSDDEAKCSGNFSMDVLVFVNGLSHGAFIVIFISSMYSLYNINIKVARDKLDSFFNPTGVLHGDELKLLGTASNAWNQMKTLVSDLDFLDTQAGVDKVLQWHDARCVMQATLWDVHVALGGPFLFHVFLAGIAQLWLISLRAWGTPEGDVQDYVPTAFWIWLACVYFTLVIPIILTLSYLIQMLKDLDALALPLQQVIPETSPFSVWANLELTKTSIAGILSDSNGDKESATQAVNSAKEGIEQIVQTSRLLLQWWNLPQQTAPWLSIRALTWARRAYIAFSVYIAGIFAVGFELKLTPIIGNENSGYALDMPYIGMALKVLLPGLLEDSDDNE
ncbi:hypothetical protein CYMTET_42061 [Cymbomonas tetramitiformis]|uniref:Uncharacterized protein n=1 Tax=Cymbomonas tetramitiformis TaxID=36881 RepID=A0AAE0C4U7_9CHLO|nr:hypothetical protein CYMTET_42061 [Cymbomonas tetramitiformis]